MRKPGNRSHTLPVDSWMLRSLSCAWDGNYTPIGVENVAKQWSSERVASQWGKDGRLWAIQYQYRLG